MAKQKRKDRFDIDEPLDEDWFVTLLGSAVMLCLVFGIAIANS